MNKPFVLGITGPTGSGKSTITKMLSEKGFAVLDGDLLARRVTQKDSAVLLLLSQSFGNDILHEDGTLNRRLLAMRAFSSSENTALLNTITHPFILREMQEEIKKFSLNGYTNIILDAAALIESGSDAFCDFTVAVLAHPETRLKRVVERDGITAEEAQVRIRAQKEDEYYRSHTDFCITTDEPFGDQLEVLMKRIKEVQDGR